MFIESSESNKVSSDSESATFRFLENYMKYILMIANINFGIKIDMLY